MSLSKLSTGNGNLCVVNVKLIRLRLRLFAKETFFNLFFNVSSKDFLKYGISYNFINIFTSLIKLFIFLENLKFYLYYLFVLKNNFKHVEGPKHYGVIYNGMPGGHKGMEVATSHLSKGGQTGQRPVLQKAGFFFLPVYVLSQRYAYHTNIPEKMCNVLLKTFSIFRYVLF